jgi:hypothetical protein
LALSSPLKGDITETFSSPDNNDKVPIAVALDAAATGIVVNSKENNIINGRAKRKIFFIISI